MLVKKWIIEIYITRSCRKLKCEIDLEDIKSLNFEFLDRRITDKLLFFGECIS